MLVTANSYYVNPNTRTLTSNIKNTEIYDYDAVNSISSQLRPVDDMSQVLNTPLNLANSTSVNKTTNSINIALGTSITVAGGFTLTVKETGVEVTGVIRRNRRKHMIWQEHWELCCVMPVEQ